MNSSSSATAACSDSIRSATSIANYTAFYVLVTIRVVIGVTSQTFALIAFRKQARTEPAYGYQIFFTIEKIIEIIYYLIFVLCQFHLSGIPGAFMGVQWFMQSYALMFFTARLLNPIQASLLNLSILLSTAMAVDRVFAFSKPFVYRNVNHKKHQAMALFICICVSFTFGSDFLFISDVQAKDGIFIVVTNVEFANSTTRKKINQSRIFLRFFCILIMIVSYAGAIKFFKKRMKQVAVLTSTTNNNKSSKEIERRRHQKMLFILISFQLPVCLVFTSVQAAANFQALYFPQASCEGRLLGTMAHICLEIGDTLDILCMCVFSGEFRRLIRMSIPCLKRFDTVANVVAVATPQANTNTVQQK